KRRRLAEAALHDHTRAVSNAAVTHRAIDIEALLSAIEIRGGDRHRELGYESLISWRPVLICLCVGRLCRRRLRWCGRRRLRSTQLSGVELDVVSQLIASNCALHLRAGRRSVVDRSNLIDRPLRPVLWLIV